MSLTSAVFYHHGEIRTKEEDPYDDKCNKRLHVFKNKHFLENFLLTVLLTYKSFTN